MIDLSALFSVSFQVLNDYPENHIFSVGNISYDVSEDAIRGIFSGVSVFSINWIPISSFFFQVGNVVSIKMVHDRETGKPKGYGFIEYSDITTAEMAIRNLNGYELSGRILRVDSAAGGAAIEDFNQVQNVPAPVEENPYGPECDAAKAPERISQTVASLAPEKMFDLMKQLQEGLINNPAEVNAILVQNPQLAYAILQAAVVMRIVDPQTALNLLHRNKAATLQPFHQHQQTVVPGMIPQQPTLIPQQPMPLPLPHNPPAQMRPRKFITSLSSLFKLISAGPPIGAPIGHPQGAPFGQVNYGQPMPPQQMLRPPVRPAQPDPAQEEQANAELLMQVMQLSEHDLQMLPEGDREKIIELRQQLKRNVK